MSALGSLFFVMHKATNFRCERFFCHKNVENSVESCFIKLRFLLNFFSRNWLLKEMVFSYSFSSFKIFRREPRSPEK